MREQWVEIHRVTRDWTAGRWWLAALNTGTQGDGMALARRTVVWLWLTAVGGGLLLVIVAMTLWVFLPRWAPALVIEHSPLIEPVVRAKAYLQRTMPDGPTVEQGWPSSISGRQQAHFDDDTWHLTKMADERLEAWGLAASSTLECCLLSSNDDVRITAAEFLHRMGLVDFTKLHDWVDDPNPWIRLKAWDLLTDSGSGIHPHPEAIAIVQRKRMALLDEPEDYIREGFMYALLEPSAWSWDQRRQVYERLPNAKVWQTYQLAIVLENLIRARLADHPQERLPVGVLFPLLDLAEADVGDATVSRRIDFLLALVDQDPGVLLRRLTAMERGEQSWVPGSERWMYTLLRSLTEQRVSLSLTGVDLKDAVRQYFPQYTVLIDPDVLAAIPPPVSLELTDVRAIDALQALAKATSTCLRLSCGAVLFAPPFPSEVSGFAPLPIIRAIDHFVIDRGDPIPDWLASWRTAARTVGDLDIGDLPLTQVLTDLGRQGGVAVDTTHIDKNQRLTDLHLRGLSLEHRLRLVAWYARLRLILRVNGIQVWPASGQ